MAGQNPIGHSVPPDYFFRPSECETPRAMREVYEYGSRSASMRRAIAAIGSTQRVEVMGQRPKSVLRPNPCRMGDTLHWKETVPMRTSVSLGAGRRMTNIRRYVCYLCLFLGGLVALSSTAHSRAAVALTNSQPGYSSLALKLPIEIHSSRENSSLLKIADSTRPNSDRLVKVFDISETGYRDWSFPAFGLIFVAIGIIVAAFPAIVKAIGIPFLDFQSGFRSFFRYAFLAFALIWTGVSFFMTYSQYLRHEALAAGHDCPVVEGPIENFVQMPFSGHVKESFSIRGVPFEYSDFILTDGFNNTSSHGGPIKSDSYVRICYDPAGNVILRLEIRDFKGPLKDYAKDTGFFSNAEDIKKFSGNTKAPPIDLPWYRYLFVLAAILDFIAIYMLFLPYLRTFLRLRTTPVRNGTILRRLEAGTKIALRNSTVYWDAATDTVWLSPRGLNVFQIPHAVAALKVDAEGKSVTEYQIRFSSGFPLIMLLFLWAAYGLVSRSAPSNAAAPPTGLFAGFLGLFCVLAVFLILRRSRSRMSRLVEDALSELCAPAASARN
jgi:hypothetical protein